MSGIKNLLDKTQEYHQIAYDILLEIGAIKECEFHSDHYYDAFSFDEQTIYAICSSMLKEKYGDKQDYKIFHSQISAIMKNAATESACPYCEKE